MCRRASCVRLPARSNGLSCLSSRTIWGAGTLGNLLPLPACFIYPGSRMQFHSISPAALLASLWQHAGLIRVSARREVLGRYQGSLLGLFWTFFTPLFMLAIYTFDFSVVFNARWGADTDSKAEFALLLFAGLIVFNIFSECITRAPGLVVGNVNYVKKVVY